jgi:hypothetical protein
MSTSWLLVMALGGTIIVFEDTSTCAIISCIDLLVVWYMPLRRTAVLTRPGICFLLICRKDAMIFWYYWSVLVVFWWNGFRYILAVVMSRLVGGMVPDIRLFRTRNPSKKAWEPWWATGEPLAMRYRQIGKCRPSICVVSSLKLADRAVLKSRGVA